MKNKLITRFLIAVAIIASLLVSAGNAFAISNSSSVVAPYWQSDGDSYTFIAVSHSSLQGMNSEIGVVLKAISDSSGDSAFGTATFTISDNTTVRVFIVATNHASINSASVAGAQFIVGTTGASFGNLLITAKASNPLDNAGNGTTATARDVTMLSYWGAIVIPSSSTGFAMEFIGDTHDSAFNSLTNASFTQKAFGVN